MSKLLISKAKEVHYSRNKNDSTKKVVDKALLRRKKQAYYKYVCVNCLGYWKGSGTCNCGKCEPCGVNYRARVPKKDAAKKKWREFILLFMKYSPEHRDKALKALEQR